MKISQFTVYVGYDTMVNLIIITVAVPVIGSSKSTGNSTQQGGGVYAQDHTIELDIIN